MNKNMYRNSLIMVLLVGTLSLVGCLNFKPKVDPTRFYTLSSVPMNQRQCDTGKIIGVARVVIPDYLDRSKIVAEIQENEFVIAEFHTWADSLDRGMTRVIVENLSCQLPGASVLAAPWRSLVKPDMELYVHVLEFKPQIYKCETLLRARYYITNNKDGKEERTEEVAIRVPLVYCGDFYLDVVASMNMALGELSRQIGDRL